ncbi:hypothetical protein ALP59_03316 [Pseudomonas savastanoi]|uniref:Uncharacterized protein n=1 Tax=Pseudomonas savastanoi TaxID=29438 RepID=A0A3M5G2F4_PSESS|nr:hypothetical protein ALP59_03316 [Pseudomonas savastanoi]
MAAGGSPSVIHRRRESKGLILVHKSIYVLSRLTVPGLIPLITAWCLARFLICVMTCTTKRASGLIPYGFTKPAFLATQALTEAMLEVTFTDSKAFPLEGGVFDFELSIKHHQANGQYTSDSSGKIIQRVTFKRCEGGLLADNFTHLSENGRETWSTRYEPKKYWANNRLAEQLADKPHVYNLGLICNRWLINWSRN